MPIYKAPVEDVSFLLNDVFQIDRYDNLPGFTDASADVREAIISEAAKLSEEVLQPLNRVGDLEGCKRHDDGSVTTPKGFKEAFKQVAEGGWLGLSAPSEYGGQGLPVTLSQVVTEFQSSANMAFSMYGGLTMGATAALMVHGKPEQKNMFVPKMVAGQWTGTMNLTEPQCGTDLGLLRTKAVKQADGSYKITGTKIFISAGEHDLTENIIHLVLARIEGAPAGIKGVSLFVVPKVLVNADGSLGARNGVSCGSIEHKMGIHGNSTCVMNYDGATGWLIGEENKGMQGMFVMMNEARLGVAVQGLAQSEVAYQNAAAYARDRLQGRSLSGAKAPAKPAGPIIVDPDVRRTLLTIRAFNEAARAMVIWTALTSDVAHRSSDPKDRQEADDHMGLMTPVLKGVLTDVGFSNAVLAQQMFGGHGYIAEHGMEQFVRDARIAMIYEGANGIQALDLVGRKLPRGGGRAVMAFFAEVAAFAKDHAADEAMKPYLTPLSTALGQLQQATMWLMQNAMAKPDNAAAGAGYSATISSKSTIYYDDHIKEGVMPEAYIYDHVRTPRGRGKPDGALHEVTALALATVPLKALKERNNLAPGSIDDVVLGVVDPVGEAGGDIARMAALSAGYGNDVPGIQINRFCASGLDAVNFAAAQIMSGQHAMTIGGGAESMSRVGIGASGGAWPMDPSIAVPAYFMPQGVSADLIATKYGFSRDDVDAYAVQSQQRAAKAWDEGRFKNSVIPVKDVNGLTILAKDEHMRPTTTMQSLGQLQPSFVTVGQMGGFDAVAIQSHPEIERINYVHHAGNSSGIVDGAGAVLLGSKEAGAKHGLKPRAKIRAFANIGSEPAMMLTGPVDVTEKLFARSGMTKSDIDLFELNEAFASVVLRYMQAFEIDNSKINVNGGAIALGHPLGATGAMILGTVLDELERTDKSTALVTLCIGGGMGTATIIERV